jgi:hypothetical protein
VYYLCGGAARFWALLSTGDKIEENDVRTGRELTVLNNELNLDFIMTLNSLPNYDPDTCIYENIMIDSSFYDVDSFTSKFKNSKQPIFLSVNIQSINAKNDNLKEIITKLNANNIPIEILALQETWAVKYVNLIDLPGFQRLIFKNRTVGRGGGVGFYVKSGLSVKLIEPPFRHFVSHVFESLTLEISGNSNGIHRHYIVSNIYRSPTAVRGYTPAAQQDEFHSKLEQLLLFLNASNKKSYVFMDSNINLLNISNNDLASSHFDIISNNGFLVANLKATRMYNGSNSLIDHILCNDKSRKLYSGSIVDDLSDHFLTFVQPESCPKNAIAKILKVMLNVSLLL